MNSHLASLLLIATFHPLYAETSPREKCPVPSDDIRDREDGNSDASVAIYKPRPFASLSLLGRNSRIFTESLIPLHSLIKLYRRVFRSRSAFHAIVPSNSQFQLRFPMSAAASITEGSWPQRHFSLPDKRFAAFPRRGWQISHGRYNYYDETFSDLLIAFLKGRKEEAEHILRGNLSEYQVNERASDGRNLLLLGIYNGPDWEDIVDTLIKKGADLRYAFPSGRYTALHLAVELRSPRMVRLLLRYKNKLDLEAKNVYGYTPFLTAVKNTYGFDPLLDFSYPDDVILNSTMRDITSQLVKAGANVEADIDTARALHLTALTLDAFLANLLLAKGADANAEYMEDDAYTPLDLLLRGAGDEPWRKDCAIAYVNYGARLSYYKAHDVMRTLSTAAFNAVVFKTYDTFDRCIVELTTKLTNVNERGKSLRNLAIAYDDQAAFVLYRLLKAMKEDRFADGEAVSLLEKRQSDIYEHVKGIMDGNDRILPPPHWEILRWSHNLALSSINLNVDLEYVKKIAVELIILKPVSKIDDDFHYSLKW